MLAFHSIRKHGDELLIGSLDQILLIGIL